MGKKTATIGLVEKMLDVNFPVSFIDVDQDEVDFVLTDKNDIEVLELSSERVVSIVVYDRNHPFRTKIQYVDTDTNIMMTDDNITYALQPTKKK